MKIQGNLINNYNYNKLNFNVTSSKEDKKAADIRNDSEEDEKAEAAKAKQRELEEAAEEIKRQAEEAKEQMEAKNKETRKFGAILEIPQKMLLSWLQIRRLKNTKNHLLKSLRKRIRKGRTKRLKRQQKKQLLKKMQKQGRREKQTLPKPETVWEQRLILAFNGV